MNWSDLEQKKMSAPFAPQETNESEGSNFTDESAHISFADLPIFNFTSAATDTTLANLPDSELPNCDDIFWGYSYVSPSIHCGENEARDEELPRLSWSYNV
jgi:hypothetical protein